MLSRRHFLELLGALVGQSILSSSSVRFIHEERFVSKDLGITFCKPAHWVFIPPELIAKEARDIGDAAGVLCGSASVMNISKEAWQYNPKRFTPGINIWSFEGDYFYSLIEMAEYVRDSHSFYREFRMTHEYENTEIAGCPAVAFTTEFIFDTIGIDRPT